MRDLLIPLLALLASVFTVAWSPEATAFLLVAALAYFLIENYSEGDDWQKVAGVLVEPEADEKTPRATFPLRFLYRGALTRILGWFDARLNPEAVDRGDAETAWSRAWGWRLYDRCLMLALLYPLVFAMLQWMASPGEAGVIGGLPVLPAETPQWRRYLAVALFLALFVYGLLFQRATARLQSVFESFAAGPKLAETLAVAVAGAGAVAFAFAGAVAVAVAVAFAGAFSFSFSFSFAFAFVSAFAFAFAFASAVVVAGALAGYLVLIIGFLWLQDRRPLAASVFFVCAVLAAYAAALRYGTLSGEVRALVLFLGLLPLVNAQFDFLSTAATRFFLRKGLAGGSDGQVRWGLIDFGVGGLCFFALCLTAVAVGHAANLLAGETVIDLPNIFANPQDHRWLFAAFLTTLLPTFLHLVLWVVSLAFAWPERLRHWCALKLSDYHLYGREPGNARLARLTIALVAGASAALCVLVARLLWLGAQHAFHIGEAILWLCGRWYGVLLAL